NPLPPCGGGLGWGVVFQWLSSPEAVLKLIFKNQCLRLKSPLAGDFEDLHRQEYLSQSIC
ncbi:hypothetical protein RZS08_07580, partial [Arthrospira platensis SPKY1]|nr:hypothetical protein [Arthrospira platensis SPKY1]